MERRGGLSLQTMLRPPCFFTSLIRPGCSRWLPRAAGLETWTAHDDRSKNGVPGGALGRVSVWQSSTSPLKRGAAQCVSLPDGHSKPNSSRLKLGSTNCQYKFVERKSQSIFAVM